MGALVAIFSAVTFAGCRTSAGFDTTIENSLERRVTYEEARHIALDGSDWDMKAAADHNASHRELEILRDDRQRASSKLEAFLSQSREGDELWLYRTYVTVDRRRGEKGLALIRGGRVVQHIGLIIFD